jgi:hypothetical protein
MAMDSTAVGGESSQRGGLRASELSASFGLVDGDGKKISALLFDPPCY